MVWKRASILTKHSQKQFNQSFLWEKLVTSTSENCFQVIISTKIVKLTLRNVSFDFWTNFKQLYCEKQKQNRVFFVIFHLAASGSKIEVLPGQPTQVFFVIRLFCRLFQPSTTFGSYSMKTENLICHKVLIFTDTATDAPKLQINFGLFTVMGYLPI